MTSQLLDLKDVVEGKKFSVEVEDGHIFNVQQQE
jgi:hypothetical protein